MWYNTTYTWSINMIYFTRLFTLNSASDADFHLKLGLHAGLQLLCLLLTQSGYLHLIVPFLDPPARHTTSSGETDIQNKCTGTVSSAHSFLLASSSW